MTTDDRLAKLQPHQIEFHRVLVDDFEQLSVKYRNTLVSELEHRDRARYAQLDEIRQQTDARHDALIKEINSMCLATQDVADAMEKFRHQIADLDARLVTHVSIADAERQRFHAELVELRDEVHAYMAKIPLVELARLAVVAELHTAELSRLATIATAHTAELATMRAQDEADATG